MSNTTGMINIPRDELVATVRAISELSIEDQRLLLEEIQSRAGAQMGAVGAMPEIDLEEIKHALGDRVEAMVDKLIINDRTVPLVEFNFQEVLGKAASDVAVTEEFEDLDDGDVDDIKAALTKATQAAKPMILQSPEEVAQSYSLMWRRIDAYRALKQELGTIDSTNQSVRNEFIRRSTTPEEWLRESFKALTKMLDQISGAMESFVNSFIDAYALTQMGDQGSAFTTADIEELKAETSAELRASFKLVIDMIKESAQVYLDQRYLEIWVEPGM